jgi:hypothetical protein
MTDAREVTNADKMAFARWVVRQLLADGSRPRGEVYELAATAGVSMVTARRAAVQLRVKLGPVWSLPD